MSTDIPPKRLRKIVKVALREGWTYDTTTAGHPRLSPPRGHRDQRTGDLMAPVTFAKSASDYRSDKNAIAALRRAGVKV